MTASTDSTVMIWDAAKVCCVCDDSWHSLLSLIISSSQGEAAMKMEGSIHNSSLPSETDPPNTPFRDIVGSQFYYMDKFILTGHNASLSLFKYYMDTTSRCTLMLFKA